MNRAATAPLVRGSRLLREGAWVAGGQALGIVAALLGTRLLTEAVPPEVYGTVALLAGAVVLLVNLFCSPVFQAILRFFPEASEGELHGTASRFVRPAVALLSLAVAAVGACAGAPSVGLLLALLLVAEAGRGFGQSFLFAARRQRRAALWQAAEAWGRPLAAIGCVALLGPTPGAVLAGFGVSTLLIFLVCRGPVQQAPAVPELGAAMLRYARPLAPLAIVGWITTAGDRYILGGTVGLAEAGIYAVTYGLISRPLLIGFGVLNQTLRPVYFEAVARGPRGEVDRYFGLWMKGAIAIGLAGVLVAGAGGALLASLLLAAPFREGAALMPWIALGHLALLVAYVYEARLFALKRTRSLLLAQGLGAVASLAVTFPMVRACGLLGAAFACPISFGLQALVTARLAREESQPCK